MGIIRVLPDEVTDLLRAGEVVERPASALKELLENSLDAGAKDIVIEIRGGGKRLISVADDGCGMSPEDAILSLQRHSTSKISGAQDLFSVTTLGFRGEALPSIASVSRLTMRTALRGHCEGIEIEAHAGKVVSEKPSAARGTFVAVRDLFFNTPGRRKFMKSDTTETAHLIDVVTKEALARFDTGFSLVADGERAVSLSPAKSLRERLLQLFGAEFLEGLRPVEGKRGGLSLTGFVSKDGNLRGTRSHQYLFVNGRPVRDRSISHAVSGSVRGEAGRHPIFFLFIEAEPFFLDVNVHPRKEEVLFKDREAVYRLVREAVGAGRGPEEARLEAGGPCGDEPYYFRPAGFYGAGPSTFVASFAAESLPLEYAKEEKRQFLRPGEMFFAYCAPEGLVIVDQHAAHERVLFERLLSGAKPSSGLLLFPRHLKIPPAQRAALLSNRDVLCALGLDVEDFGEGSVLLRSIPDGLAGADHLALVLEAADALTEGRGAISELKEAVAARLACHTSVRGRQTLTDEELSRLLADLDRCEDPDHCPHGRPTRVVISFEEMKRMFRRG